MIRCAACEVGILPRVTAVVRPRDPSNVGVPALGAGIVSRPRAVGELLRRLEGARVLHVTAPAGAGKTTLVAQAAQELDIPLGWLTLEEWDRDPSRLLRDVVAALGRALPAVRSVVGDDGDDPREGARRVGSVVGAREVALVVDNAHLLNGWEASAEVVAALLTGRADGLKLVLVSRSSPRLPRVGAEVLARSAELGDDVLRADAQEAAAILAARGSDADPAVLLAETGGWVTGLVLGGRRGELGAVDGLAQFLRSEVRPGLSPAEDALLVGCSIFDYIDYRRAQAVAGDEAPSMLAAVRAAGVPGVWDEQRGRLSLHPRIREILRAELETGPRDALRAALAAAASAYEGEGLLELALDAAVGATNLAAARQLLPQVIGTVVARLEVDRAGALLAAVPFPPGGEPDEVVVARIELASLRQRGPDGLAVIDELNERGDLHRIVRARPNVGALACNILAASGRIDEAIELLEVIPVGRGADAAHLILSAVRDDPDVRIPAFEGDSLDAVIARGLYCRGKIAHLRRLSNATLARLSGVPQLAGEEHVVSSPLAAGLARFADGVAARDRNIAEASVEEIASYIGERSIFASLALAEMALRLERDPARALLALDQAKALPQAEVPFYRELIETWRGGALLLRGDADAEALAVLRGVVRSMLGGDRALELPTALVYLAEAEWRGRRDDAADRATRDADDVARRNGLLTRLMLALADFPGVLSRALDLEPEPDGHWHALGRAIVASSAGLSIRTGTVHLREFGEPALLVDGIAVRPKIRKSVELLSYLVSRPRLSARRSDVLHALWNGRDDDATRAYLRQAVRHVRDVLPSGALEADGDILYLVGGFTSDVAEFDALLRSAAQTEGLERRALLLEAIEKGRRGAFLEGSREVAWIDERRAHIEARLLGARLDVAETLLDESRFLDVLVLADEVLERDPQLERGWRLRMRALGMLGDLDGVVDAFRECSAALHTLGLTPSRGTTELARRLRA